MGPSGVQASIRRCRNGAREPRPVEGVCLRRILQSCGDHATDAKRRDAKKMWRSVLALSAVDGAPATKVDRDRVGCEIVTCGAAIADSVPGVGEGGILKYRRRRRERAQNPPGSQTGDPGAKLLSGSQATKPRDPDRDPR